MKKLLVSMMLLLCIAGTSWATPYDLTLGRGNYDLTGIAALTGYTGAYATLTIDSAGAVDFKGLQNVLYNGHYFDFYLTEVGLNIAGTPPTPPQLPTGLYLERTPASFDGFGKFDFGVGVSANNGAAGSLSEIAFNLGQAVDLTGNNNGYLAAAHVVVFEDDVFTSSIATGYATNGTSGAAPVPEPGTVILLGAGLLSLAIYTKRRKSA